MADPSRYDQRRAHRMIQAWLRRHGWTPEQMHQALQIESRYQGDLGHFADFARADKAGFVRSPKAVIEFCHRHDDPGPFDKWIAVNSMPDSSQESIMARVIEKERQREERRQYWLRREPRGCGRRVISGGEFDGLDAEAIRALSGGTIRMGVVRYG
jgi:hypothetical protein